MKETMTDRLSETSMRGFGELVYDLPKVELHISSGIKGVSHEMARYSVTPTPDALLSADDIKNATDEEVARILSQKVSIDDPNLEVGDKTEQQVFDTASLAAAKAQSLEEEIKDKGVRQRLQEFRESIWKGAGQTIVKTGTASSVLALALTACSSGVGAVAPETGGQVQSQEPVATEEATMPEPTEEATTTPEPTPTPEIVQFPGTSINMYKDQETGRVFLAEWGGTKYGAELIEPQDLPPILILTHKDVATGTVEGEERLEDGYITLKDEKREEAEENIGRAYMVSLAMVSLRRKGIENYTVDQLNIEADRIEELVKSGGDLEGVLAFNPKGEHFDLHAAPLVILNQPFTPNNPGWGIRQGQGSSEIGFTYRIVYGEESNTIRIYEGTRGAENIGQYGFTDEQTRQLKAAIEFSPTLISAFQLFGNVSFSNAFFVEDRGWVDRVDTKVLGGLLFPGHVQREKDWWEIFQPEFNAAVEANDEETIKKLIGDETISYSLRRRTLDALRDSYFGVKDIDPSLLEE